jgi:hypothetical protein
MKTYDGKGRIRSLVEMGDRPTDRQLLRRLRATGPPMQSPEMRRRAPAVVNEAVDADAQR